MRQPSLPDLSERAREIFRTLVDAYLDTGEPVGSRTLARRLNRGLSPATVRNVMQDLKEMGLLSSPHASAGRLPSELGLRLFVDALLEVGDLASEDSARIAAVLTDESQPTERVLAGAGKLLSGLSKGASLVLAPTEDKAIEHVHFLQVSEINTLASLVMEDGTVENRLFTTPLGMTQAVAQEAANFLNAHMRGRTLEESKHEISRNMEEGRRQLDSAAEQLVEAGMASWEGTGRALDRLIVRGLSNLLDPGLAEDDVERLRRLFDDLERQRTAMQLLDLVREADGVRVFIGSENPMFSLAGSSLVISPYMDGRQRVIGALAVIGPTRLNYGRVVPAVDFTARLVSRLLERGAEDEVDDVRISEDQ